MHEIFPVVVGAALGLTFWRQPKSPGTILFLALLAICAALVASAISGELALSWWYVGVDLNEIVIVAVVTALAALILRRGGQRHLQQ